MIHSTSTTTRLDLPIILGLVLLLCFASPLVVWWSRLNLPWYTPYALWALFIVLTAWLNSRNRTDEP